MNHSSSFKASALRGVSLVALLLSVVLAWQEPIKAWGDDGPTLVKTSLHIRVSQNSVYKPSGATAVQNHTTCWAPQAEFDVRGPVPPGSQFSMDFTRPDGSAWLHFDLPTQEIAADRVATLKTPSGTDLDPYENKFTRAVGVFGFSIHLNNALEGQSQTLFSGKFTVGKVSESLGIPQMKNMYNYYVDHDWALPIGYVWFKTRDEPQAAPLRVSMWFRGETTGANLEGHLFYQGKQIASTTDSSGDMDSEVEQNTVTVTKGDPRWILWAFGWDSVRRMSTPSYGQSFSLDKNPGQYEVKVLRDGKLCRDMTFTVGDDGKVVDTGIGNANHMGTTRIIVPVKVMGTLDGPWKAEAWKTDAFYGNPLAGFTAP